MSNLRRILLLAGSAEAREIAIALRKQGMDVQALTSEPPRGTAPMPVPFEVCPNVTQVQLVQAMQDVEVVIDASHGFDHALSATGHAAAALAGLPIVSLLRPAWDVNEDPNWQRVSDVAAAMPMIPTQARVFSATGWASLPAYATFPGSCLMLRQTSRHERTAPFGFVELVFGDAPFTVAQEVTLFQERRVDVLIARNLGGLPSRPKLEAAKQLGLKVILIDRPPLPLGVRVVQTVDEVLDWVAQI